MPKSLHISKISSTFAAEMDKVILYGVIAVCLLSCADPSHTNEPTATIQPYGEQIVYDSQDTIMFLCDHEWTNITLSNTNPDTLDIQPWRIPTLEEATYLHQQLVSYKTNQRFLCVDSSGIYYTFLFGKVGSITQAGSKTKYALRPIRTIIHPKDTIIQL